MVHPSSILIFSNTLSPQLQSKSCEIKIPCLLYRTFKYEHVDPSNLIYHIWAKNRTLRYSFFLKGMSNNWFYDRTASTNLLTVFRNHYKLDNMFGRLVLKGPKKIPLGTLRGSVSNRKVGNHAKNTPVC